MGLAELPTEILQQIILHTIPDGFEQMVLTCRLFYQAGGHFLPEYNRNRKRFRHFKYSRPADGATPIPEGLPERDAATDETGIRIQTTTQLLHAIAKDPPIARYIVSADLRRPDQLDRRRNVVGNLRFGTDTLHGADDLVRLARASESLHNAGIDPDEFLRGGYASIDADVFLLSLLPNLRELTPNVGYIEEHLNHDYARRLVGAIVRRANAAVDGAPLSRLAVLRPFAGGGFYRHESLAGLEPFLALPSLRELYAGSCVLKYDEFVLWADPDRYGGPAHGSHLHTLELFACVFDTRGLAALLGRTPALRKLHLAQQGKMGLFNVVGVVGSAVEAAQRCVGKTLEELSFTMMEPFPAVEATPVVGMGGFERLRVLEMDLSMLTGLADDSEPALPSDTDLGDGGDRARCRPGELATPRLVDVLPRAIETVSLLYRPTSAPQQDAQHIRRLFDGLAGERGAKLPNLNTVTILAPHLRRLSPEVAEALQETQHQGCSLLLRRNPCFEFVATFRERFGLPDEEMENGSPDYLPPVNR